MFDSKGVVGVDKTTLGGFEVIFGEGIGKATKLKRRSRIERACIEDSHAIPARLDWHGGLCLD
jgi:hypothetical protein